MRYRVEHEEIKFVSTREHVIFCLLYKHTDDDVFDDFPKMSEDSSKVVRRPGELFRKFPKISTDNQRFSEDAIFFKNLQLKLACNIVY